MSVQIARIAMGTPAFRRLASAMLAAGLSTFALLYATQPMLPALAARFHVSAAEASLAVSLATGPMAIALLFAGAVSDRLGRRPVMIASLFAASLLTLLSALVPDWHVLLATRLLVGLALSGVPAVAMAYVAEEVDGGAIGAAMGLYISGSTIGGMAGRLGVSLIADQFGWRAALAVMGALCLAVAMLFAWLAPPSRGFVSRRHDGRSFVAGLGRLWRDDALCWLYLAAFVLMGAFVTLYNYAGFHLQAPPYRLSQSAVGAIFLLYIVGTFSSAWFGSLAGRRGPQRVFWIPTALFLLGLLLADARSLAVMIIGIGVATGAFFGAHSIASTWVSRRAGADRAQAASLYLFFYYMGSSVLGSVGGIAWSDAGWRGIVGFAGVLLLVALAIAVRLRFVPDRAAS
jgi:YNFM family putative membrane transporter